MRIDESHDAWMNRRVEPHADSNFSLRQVIDQCTLVVDPKWIAQIHGFASLRDGRRLEAAFRQAPVIDLRDRVPPREVTRQMPELRDCNSSVRIRQAFQEARRTTTLQFGVRIFRALHEAESIQVVSDKVTQYDASRTAKKSKIKQVGKRQPDVRRLRPYASVSLELGQARRQLFVPRECHTTHAGAYQFRLLHAEVGRVAKRADGLPEIFGAQCVRTILDQPDPQRSGQLRDRVEIAGHSKSVLYDYGPGLRGDLPLYVFRIKVQGPFIDIGVNRPGAAIQHRIGNDNASVSRHHDFVVGSYLQSVEYRRQSNAPGTETSGISAPHHTTEEGFEFGNAAALESVLR